MIELSAHNPLKRNTRSRGDSALMNITIIKASVNYIEDCKVALVNSELGRQYFPVEANAIFALREGIEKEEVYIALNNKANCMGFIWFIQKGAFHSFPYLHIIAVKDEYRGLGIGKRLIEFFEDSGFENNAKVFLVVADFNPKAKKLYMSLGYKEVGSIPDLYKRGVTEYLMMKEKTSK